MYLINGSLLIEIGVICYLAVRSILIGFKLKKQKQVYWLREVITFLFVLYILMVVSVTLFPLALWINFNMQNIKFGLNLAPFVGIINDIKQIGIAYDGDTVFMISLIIRNVGGNILLLMPLSVLSPIIWNKFKDFKNIVLFGLVISISIESIQFIELIAGGLGRTVDIDDVICNVLGVILGYFIYKFTFKIADKFQIEILQNLNSGNSRLFDNDKGTQL
ncbi:VanZ family protein [Peribacillus simplex]|uniref:VanZ family protein n=1 Tax=Peribacillus simplex TaxID=1478 RepID=UPI000F63AD70|nr:VanZ family protein [Peribacillus simplex]RRN71374.1 VanZ family protein [Peribacillus simplex]